MYIKIIMMYKIVKFEKHKWHNIMKSFNYIIIIIIIKYYIICKSHAPSLYTYRALKSANMISDEVHVWFWL